MLSGIEIFNFFVSDHLKLKFYHLVVSFTHFKSYSKNQDHMT